MLVKFRLRGLRCVQYVQPCCSDEAPSFLAHSPPPHTPCPPPFRCRPERDPLLEVQDAKLEVARALGQMSAAQPGRVPQLAQAAMSPELQQKLAGYCQAAGVAIA